MPKLFATDFDGTLYHHDRPDPISAADLDAIASFQQAGGLFGACTGRPVRALTMQSLGVVPFDFYIALTGATLHDRDVHPIATASLPREVVRAVYERCRPYARNGQIMVCAQDNFWTIGEPVVDWPMQCVANFDELPEPVQGVGMENETIEIAQWLAQDVMAAHPGVVDSYVNLASIDVVPHGHSKGTGLRRAAAHFGATLTGGIGDSFNDLPLLEAADVAYTFHSAPEEMRAQADVLVDSVAEALADFAAR